jgi:lysophospholipase L1-like esterase
VASIVINKAAMKFRIAFIFLCLLAFAPQAQAQGLDARSFKIEWQVVNRFRLFHDAAMFKQQVVAWRQYLLYVDGLHLADDQRDAFVARTSVLGIEHVLNDRRIAFSTILRDTFDWRGWAAGRQGATCYDSTSRAYTACGGLESYINPDHHEIELWLTPLAEPLPAGTRCEWRIGGLLVAEADCSKRVSGPDIALPYPGGAEISVNVAGGTPILLTAKVRDLLVVGLGDSFASGEGNPDQPVQFGDARRFRNLYPLRAVNDVSGSAQWTDTLCHRSLYGHQMRAALQLAIENPQAAITYLDYSCSGAGVTEGLLGPQTYVERQAETDIAAKAASHEIAGGSTDSELYRLMRDLCYEKPVEKDGLPVCANGHFRRSVDFVFLSIGGNDIGFSNVVAWATLRDGVSSAIAGFFGATVSSDEFAKRMKDVLPEVYARLAKALETVLPLYSANDGVFDPQRIVLTSYPDLVTDENGGICKAGDGPEDLYPANQSLDMFSSWLVAHPERLEAVRKEFATLYREMRDLAGDHGWSFAGHAYADRMFEGHGFCARDLARSGDPAEALIMPCWGKAERDTQTCQSSWSGKERNWRPYNPATENYPYALRQRWVRSFNDAYMVINQKVIDRRGRVDEKASAAVFSETTGALHPTAEGHAAMADALLLTVRPMVQSLLEEP